MLGQRFLSEYHSVLVVEMAFAATAIATGLLSGIAGKVGARIFDEVFPPEVPSYFGVQ